MVNKYIKTRENINKVIPAKIYIPKAKETGYRLFPCHSFESIYRPIKPIIIGTRETNNIKVSVHFNVKYVFFGSRQLYDYFSREF